MPALKGTAYFEPLSPDDLLTAVQSLRGQRQQRIFVDPPGRVDQQIAWAVSDLKAARNETAGADRDRHLVNAVMNARRAMGCLVDLVLKTRLLSAL
jgi:xanthine/CO dehydrogenase XdhC/CoxF family maturation factor